MKTNSKENFCKPRGHQHTYYYIVVIIVAGMKMHMRKEVQWGMTTDYIFNSNEHYVKILFSYHPVWQ